MRDDLHPLPIATEKSMIPQYHIYVMYIYVTTSEKILEVPFLSAVLYEIYCIKYPFQRNPYRLAVNNF